KLPAALFVMTGFCGGFTTFSTFSLKTIELIQANEWPRAAGNITASVAICLTFTWLGFFVAQSLKKSPA
ncbi:MAG: CrcB family protein, partial [Myxococcota bacterium]|nr:CrcB family protein [Myxococcota bacterium]